jgi:hypothetical protein
LGSRPRGIYFITTAVNPGKPTEIAMIVPVIIGVILMVFVGSREVDGCRGGDRLAGRCVQADSVKR